MKPVSPKIFINQKSKHNKFWIITAPPPHTSGDNIVITRHGRLGTKGQTYTKNFDSNREANAFASTKIAEKNRKGYVEIKQEQLDEMHIQSAIIGTQNKLEEFGWVEMVDITDSTVVLKPVLDARLAEPDYDPAIRVVVGMRSKHFKDKISIVLTADSIYQVTTFRTTGSRSVSAAQIDEQHELFDMCNKIKEAVSHSL